MATRKMDRTDSSPAARKMPSAATCRRYSTIAIGVLIPLFSLALSSIGGRLLRADGWQATALGLSALALMLCVLAVSLSHLAWAISNLTRSPMWASWLLAIACDAALVLGELIHVGAPDTEGMWVVPVMMTGVCLLSAWCNCWAFLYGPSHDAREEGKAGKAKPAPLTLAS